MLLTHCLFQGTTAADTASLNMLLTHCLFQGTTAADTASLNMLLTHCLFKGTTAADTASLNNLRITKWKCRPCGIGKQLQEKLKFFLCLILFLKYV